jgi:hypothetical protein
MGWLFGALGEAGIQLPESFDLKGILSLILQVLGITYDNVRGIAVKLVGDKIVGAVEKTVKFFVVLVQEGPAGLWEFIKEKIAEIDIKEMVLGAIKDFVITKVITAGVTWLISMLNPAAAFVKACKMIYDVIMFFIERGSQIMEFVNSIMDGIGAIAAGSIGSAANLVEGSLAKILPLAISFLASLLGLGGIADKIKAIIEKIRAPINKLISSVVGAILKPLKKLYDKGAKFVKGVVDKGKALGKKALNKVKDKAKGLLGGKGKADPASAESQSKHVKELAHTELTRRTQQAFATREALQAVVSDVLDKLRPQGLKDLAMHPKPEAPGKFVIVASASAATPVDEAEVVSDEVPAKRWLPASFRVKGVIRKKLYERGSGWGTLRTQVNKWAVDQFMPLVDLIKDGFLRRDEARAEIQKNIDAGLLPKAALQQYENRQFNARWIETQVKYHVDHIQPLAGHWVGGGNNAGDAERRDKTTNQSNLRWITQEANLAKGSKGEDEDEGASHYLEAPWVGPAFTSELADDGKPKARTIDGQPFVDEHGKPLP